MAASRGDGDDSSADVDGRDREFALRSGREWTDWASDVFIKPTGSTITNWPLTEPRRLA